MSNEELAIQARTDQAALETLWKINQGFIYQESQKYSGFLESEDAMQECFLALYSAVANYDPQAGTFLNYFSYWIRAQLGRAISKNSNLSAAKYNNVKRYRKALATFEKDHGREPSDLEAAEMLGITPEDLAEIKAADLADNPASLDAPKQNEDGDAWTLADTLQSAESPENEIIEKEYREELKAQIWDTVDTLPEDEANTIRKRYQDGETLQKISEANGETINATAWKEKKGLRDLKRGKRGRTLRPYYEGIFSQAIAGEGSGTFSRTWTSATERTALNLYEKNRPE